MKGSFKTALIAAVVSAFVAAGAAVATTKTFVLGTTNTVDAATSVSASGSGLNTKMLQLTNTNAGSSATALGLTTANSRPPMIVTSQAKVANLNVDKLDGIDSSGFLSKTGKAADSEKLDGIDSTGFVQGRGTFLSNRLVFVSDQKTLLTIPGLGALRAHCGAIAASITWFNDTGGNVDVWRDTNNSHFVGEVLPPGSVIYVADRSVNVSGGTLALGVGNDPAARRTALLHAFAFQSGDNAPCGFQVQGTLWTSQ